MLIDFVPGADPPVAYVTTAAGGVDNHGSLWAASWDPNDASFRVQEVFDFSQIDHKLAIAIGFNHAADRAFAWSLGVIGPIALGLAAAALLLPARGVRDRVRRAKREELERVRQAIQGNTDALANSAIAKRAGSVGLVDLLAYRQYVDSVREWPFDAPMLGRFALFTLLPLGSWLGGALVERVLGSLLD